MLGRLLQRLQHGVEGVIGEHVHFVDHVDLEARIRWRVNRLLQQLRHFIDAAIGGGIHFDVVNKAAGINCRAGFADAAWLGGDTTIAIGTATIERLGQNPRQSGFTDATRTGKQIGMMQSLLLQRMGQRPHDVFLPDQRFEAAGAVFTGEDLIGHKR
jgi:hypothetical protein